MILSDNDIHTLLDAGELIDGAVDYDQIQPASLDVRLGEELLVPDTGVRIRSDVHALEPWVRYHGHTLETVNLPNDIAAQLSGRSTVGRLGVIVHKTAGWIDPGFRGELTFELMNMGDEPVEFSVGDRIAQLVFVPLLNPSSGYTGKYQNQTGATAAKFD